MILELGKLITEEIARQSSATTIKFSVCEIPQLKYIDTYILYIYNM